MADVHAQTKVEVGKTDQVQVPPPADEAEQDCTSMALADPQEEGLATEIHYH